MMNYSDPVAHLQPNNAATPDDFDAIAAEVLGPDCNLNPQPALRRNPLGIDIPGPVAASDLKAIDEALSALEIADGRKPDPVADQPQVADEAQAAPVENVTELVQVSAPLNQPEQVQTAPVENVTEQPQVAAPIEPDISLAPGCFSCPALYNPDAKECVTCPFAGRCAPMAGERHAKLEAKLVAHVQAERAKATAKQAKWRAKAKVTTPTTAAPVATPTPAANAGLPERIRRLKDWLESGHRATRKLRGHTREIVEDWIKFEALRRKLGRDPKPTEFGAELGINRQLGGYRLDRLERMTQPGYPWAGL